MHTPQTQGWRGLLLALLTGSVIPLCLAPYSIWPLGIAATTTFALLLGHQSIRQVLLRSWLFGVGMYGSGVSWVYISIHDFGFTGAPLAVVMTIAFVIFLAAVFAAPFYLYGKFFNRSRLGFVLCFPIIWVFGEWLRSWIFTGFPWLYLGYSHLDTWLSAWAPIGGVFTLSFLTIFSGAALSYIYSQLFRRLDPAKRQYKLAIQAVSIALLAIWLGGLMLQEKMWTTPEGEPQSLAIIQPNIPLPMKWNPYYFPEIIDILDNSAEQHWDKDLQIWPEAAIPSVYHDMESHIDSLNTRAKESRTNLITGVLYDNPQTGEVYNGITGLGLASQMYFKQKLVPFGEYVPFEDALRGLINFFDLPSSVVRIGPHRPEGLSALSAQNQSYKIAPFICYEIVYPDFVAHYAQDKQLLLTISNDAWFGDSIGPLQHFEMARMRALENQKPLIRATNTGISAVIDPKGQVVIRGKQFVRETISSEVQLHSGVTPYSRLGSWPLLCGMLIGFIFSLYYLSYARPKTQTTTL